MPAVRASGRWLVEHRFVLFVGLAAALPVIVSTLRAVANGWIPLGDDAVIAVRAIDVLSTDTPLLGQYSASSSLAEATSHSLGPLLYWLLAVPSRLGSTPVVVAMGLVNVAAVMAAVALARRRGGAALMVAAAAGLALACASLPPETIHSIWNPSAAQLPFALLIFLAWSVGCGEHRLLPLTVLVASFVVQAHLTYVLPTAGLLAVGLAGLAYSRREPAVSRHEPARPWAIAALAVGLVCWSAPLLEQATSWPGNFVAVGATALSGEPTLGPSAGWHAVVRTVGVPPWWLGAPRDPLERLAEVTTAPSFVATVSAVLVLAGLAGLVVVGLRRRRPDVAGAGAIGLVLCAGIGAVASSTPSDGGLVFTISYTLRWASPAGMWIWLALGWSGALLLAKRGRIAVPSVRAARFGSVAAVAAIGAIVAAGTGPDLLERRYEPAREVADRVRAELETGDAVSVEAGIDAFDYQAAVVYELRRTGTSVIAPSLAAQLGGRYDRGEIEADQVVWIGPGAPRDQAPGRVVARVRDVPPGEDPAAGSSLTVRLSPARPAR